MRDTSKGFTLIELMISVVIVGLLAAGATASYQSFLVKGTRAAAQSTLMDLAQKEQQYFLDNRSFASTIEALNSTLPDTVSHYYTVTINLSAGLPPGFTISAVPISTTRQSSDGTLTIDQAGTKTPADKW